MTMRFEYVDAASAVIAPRIIGEHTSDGEKVEHSHIALEVYTAGNTDGVILAGGKDELIELATRIIEQAVITELRREQQLVGWSSPSWKKR
jgi:hypothetical protein